MALDLSGVRRVVEGMLEDELELWRDSGGTSPPVLNEESGALVQREEGQVMVWAGPGAILRRGQLAGAPPLAGAVAALSTTTTYQALLPLAAPPVVKDDGLRVARSARDVELERLRFRVADVDVGKFVVARVLLLEPLF
ncbi:DUF6093 family protein [Streptomyces sp. NPDC001728]|uniref:DUF6093 family protein n=1 Tax=Streptomyces sp. NPDC001728 TaxID=3154396 RepID=UPI0033337223